eukprot:g387.t1
MSVSELKHFIVKCGGKFRDCSTVQKLRRRAKDVRDKKIRSLENSSSQACPATSNKRKPEGQGSIEMKLSALSIQDRSNDCLDTNRFENGLVGLKNIGNTCFMNSCLQCLSNVKPLRRYLFSLEDFGTVVNKKSSTKGRIVEAFASLLKRMWLSPNCSAETPTKMKSVVGAVASRFLTYHQQDAQEFMVYLLDGMHEDLNRIRVKPEYKEIEDRKDGESDGDLSDRWWKHYELRNDSAIKDMFAGQLRSELTCSVCQRTSVRFDPFWDLSLPIPSSCTKNSVAGSLRRLARDGKCDLYDCLRAYVKAETLDDSEAPHCTKCGKSCRATKRMTIFRLPQVLVLHIKRFSEVRRGRFGRRQKLNVNIACPIVDLDMRSFCASSSEANDSNSDNKKSVGTFNDGSTPYKYDLVAVSNHIGSIRGGHYTADCFNSEKRAWYHFDDARVSRISEKSGKINERTAYILFYTRREISGEERRSSPSNLN